jgi:hypothetical protein
MVAGARHSPCAGRGRSRPRPAPLVRCVSEPPLRVNAYAPGHARSPSRAAPRVAFSAPGVRLHCLPGEPSAMLGRRAVIAVIARVRPRGRRPRRWERLNEAPANHRPTPRPGQSAHRVGGTGGKQRVSSPRRPELSAGRDRSRAAPLRSRTTADTLLRASTGAGPAAPTPRGVVGLRPRGCRGRVDRSSCEPTQPAGPSAPATTLPLRRAWPTTATGGRHAG